MQLFNPVYPDYLLKYARENHRLTMEQVVAKTGIDKKQYEAMEAGYNIIDTADAGLLGELLKIKPQYIEAHNMQLQLLYAAKDMMRIKDEKIASLTSALKRKIRSGVQ